MNCCCVWEDVAPTSGKYDHIQQCQHDLQLQQQQQQQQSALGKCQPNTKAQVCERLKQYHELSTILQSVLDITATIVQIMGFVCIHQCKCQKAMDVIVYAFLHFDEFIDRPCGHSRKQIRKDDFQCDLRRDCCFTKQETKITYAITKYAFQAFYYKQVVTRFDDSFIDECAWLMAAKKTVKAYKQLDGVEPLNVCTFSTNVHCAYKHYLERRRENIDRARSKYECCCNQNRSMKPEWPSCDTGKQPCSGKKTGREFTKKDCTCVCDDNKVPDNEEEVPSKPAPDSVPKPVPDAASVMLSIAQAGDSDCMKLKTCEERLKCVLEQLEQLQNERDKWQSERTELQASVEKLQPYEKIIEKVGSVEKLLSIKRPEEFSVCLKFFENGTSCEIALTGIDVPDEFPINVSDLKITHDTSTDRPVNFHCIRTEF